MPYTIKPGSFKYKKSNGQFSEIDCFEGPDSPVTDVQINGTTILDAQGVANVPVADANNLGVVMPNASGGIDINPTTNKLRISNADNSQVRNGTDVYKPITPSIQHSAAFYGLAKAAGINMASSSNPVGQYTPEAIVAIQKMLGVYQPPFELIRDITLEERTSPNITVDNEGLPLNLLSVFMEIFYENDLETESNGYGRYLFYDQNNNSINTETSRYITSTAKQFKMIFIQRLNNLVIGYFTRVTTVGNSGTWQTKSSSSTGYAIGTVGNITRIAMNSADYEPAGTRIKIWGQRAY